ncbi:solute carrier organic anion transporter family member 1B3-like [Rana temporaria]|uniref:solute carrier organic anion transporter family member 1B3-like n=1 Tax=Rana temporaria TaxID=8407 RepID=UPI001AADDBC7|nr:solute carrier organic anion transporter family member 1B3-like [Rana temporaria]
MAAEKDDNEQSNLNTNPASMEQNALPDSQKSLCCSTLKMFLAALSFTYFAKAFSGSYMKSSITQIERRFDLSSSTVGMVDGSFEIGNLLVIPIVSYFGAKLHRPRIIAAGCLLMSLGSFLTVMPHFFIGLYKYESARAHPASSLSNITGSVSPCMANQMPLSPPDMDCGKETNYMWVYILIGNMLRGIGETPITPLGISYIDDFAGSENTALYLAFLHAVGLFGPMVGFTLGSFFAKLYVDVGFVDMDEVTISPQDTRWVGAWWMGFLVAGTISLLSAIPFCFLPRNIKRPEVQKSADLLTFKEKEKLEPQKKATMKGFLLALKKLACNHLYILLMAITLLQTNSFIGFITYKPKYMEQQYGQSISRANFITGVSTLPAAAAGMFLGGLIMKKYKFGLLWASKMSFITAFIAFIMSLSVFIIGCENHDVAGITVTYNGSKVDIFGERSLFSSCNSECHCSSSRWDPVCGENKITYMSACLAGCKSSSGAGKAVVYHNCSCIESLGFPSANSSVVLGVCPPTENCASMFVNYIILQIFYTFIYAIGGSAYFVIILWSVSPELKSLAIGVYMLLVRTLAGIPAPMYFGALLDKTCLKWGTKFCGGKGACRMYDTESFRNTFLGLTAGIRAPSFILFIWFIIMVKKRASKRSPENGAQQENGSTKKEEHTKDATKDECAALELEKESCM